METQREVVGAGLWRRTDRDEVNRLVATVGGARQVVSFEVRRDELLRRLAKRNRRGPTARREALNDFITPFESRPAKAMTSSTTHCDRYDSPGDERAAAGAAARQ